MRRRNTLYINNWESRCGTCGLGCNPNEKGHYTTLGYYAKDAEKPAPCGQPYWFLSSDYLGTEAQEAAKDMRPDLKWVDL